MQSRWHHRPVLHTRDSGHEKRPGWLELFYDLVYVAAFIQLGSGLAHHPTVEGFLAFAAVFVPLWVAWTGFTWFVNRFTVDDFVHRLVVFGQMLFVGAMAIFAPEVLDDRPERFALAYAGAQAVVALLHLRTWHETAEGRDYSLYWGAVFAVGASLWAASVALEPPWTYGLWGAGLVAILTAPLSRTSRALTERYPVDLEHLTERYGLLTLIVLGEAFVKVLSGITADDATPTVLAQTAMTLLITVSLWWIYFDDVAGSRLKSIRLGPLIWLYAHIPLQLAVTAAGVAVKKAGLLDLGAPAPTEARWLLCGALALAFVAVAILDSVTERRQAELSDRWRVVMRVGSAALMLLLAPAGGALTAGAFLGIVTALCVVQVAFDMMMAPLETAAHEPPPITTTELHQRRLAGDTATRLADPLGDVVRKGTPSELRRDLYAYLMEGSWGRVLGVLVFLYLVINVFFGALYLLQPGCIADARPDSFADAFSFSVQTMATIGFGRLNPVTPYADALVAVEAAVGLIGAAFATGLVFAKASRPRAAALFSRVALVSPMTGVPTLHFRIGNARGTDIVDAAVTVTALRDTVTPEGTHLRRQLDLRLVRRASPFFRLTWTVMHPIDEDSPLRDVDWERGDPTLLGILAVLTGHDGTYGSTVYARHAWDVSAIRRGERFVDVLSQLPDGRLMVDYTRFHDTEPDPAVLRPPPAAGR